MLSKTGFFELNNIESTEGKYHANVNLNSTHEIYNGHFPGQPVIPGVCMLEMIKEIYQQETEQDFFVTNIKTIKFLSIIDPTAQSAIEIIIQEVKVEEEGVELKAEIRDTEKAYFKFRGRFQKR